jgi:hypothetical protein
VYKRFKDTMMDAVAKIVLVTVLVVSLYYDEQSDARNGGQAAHADIMYCSNFLAEASCETTTGLCDWDATDSRCAARPAAADAADAGVLQHLLYSLPGLAPLLLNWIFKPRNRKPKAETKTSEGQTGIDPGLEGTGDWTVVRVGYSHNPPPPLPPAPGAPTRDAQASEIGRAGQGSAGQGFKGGFDPLDNLTRPPQGIVIQIFRREFLYNLRVDPPHAWTPAEPRCRHTRPQRHAHAEIFPSASQTRAVLP